MFPDGNGPHIELDSSGTEIDAIAAEGFTNDPDGNKVFGGRIGVLPVPWAEVGFSAAGGDAAIEGENSRFYRIYDADLSARWKEFSLRAEWVTQELGAEPTSVAPDKFYLEGWYIQGSYRIPKTKFEGIIRASQNYSPHPDLDYGQVALGLDYWFNSHTVAKLAYEFNDGMKGTDFNDDVLLLQLAYGF